MGKQGSCSNYGMVAVDDITEGEKLFSIPREVLLHPENCSISSVLKEGEMPVAVLRKETVLVVLRWRGGGNKVEACWIS